MICAAKGYKAHFVSSDAFSAEKLQTMRAFGAELDIIPSQDGKITAQLIDSMVQRAKELSKDPNTFWTDQFNNVDNRNAYHKMASEILEALDGRIDEFIMESAPAPAFPGIQKSLKINCQVSAALLSNLSMFVPFPGAIRRECTGLRA
jgi:cysteine synthase A